MPRRRPTALSLPTFYDLYQTLLAIVGMVGVCRILFDFSWLPAAGYAVGTVAAYWAGTGLFSLFQKGGKRNAKPSTD